MDKRKNKIILLNAGREFYKGKPKNHISEEGINKIAHAFIEGRETDRFLKVITKAEAAENDYNLSPSRYVSLSEEVTYRPVTQILSDLKIIQEEEKRSDRELARIFKKLGPQLKE